MNLDALLTGCAVLMVEVGHPRGDDVSGNISMACPLAAWQHADPHDRNLSCSVSYGPEVSLVRCFSGNCAFSGSFYRMLWEVAEARRRPHALMEYIASVAPTERVTLQGKLANAIKQYEYAPATSAAHGARVQRQVLDESYLLQFKSDSPHPYLLQRGVMPSTAAEWEVGYDAHRRRVTFPVRRADGKLVGLTGRAVDPDHQGPKYHNYVGIKKSEVLFGEHFLTEGAPVVAVEGQFDALLTRQASGHVVIAPLGEGFTRRHVQTLAASRPPWLIVFPDNDAAGRLMAEKIVAAIDQRFFVRITLPPPGCDPASISTEQRLACLNSAVPVLKKIRWAAVDEVARRV